MHPLEAFTGHKINKMRRASKVFYQSYMNHVRSGIKDSTFDKIIIIDIVSLDMSFDLIWVKEDNVFEYFPSLF